MTDLLYQLFGSTSEISFPTNCAVICGNNTSPINNPSIDTFTITPPSYSTTSPINSVTLTLLVANVVITPGDNLDSSSLKIKYNDTTIYTGSAVSGTLTIPLDPNIVITAGESNSASITFTAEIADTNGTKYTKTATVTLTVTVPTSSNLVYYGSTSTIPLTFLTMAIADIFALNPTSQAITGTSNVDFVIHQTDIIHYLLVPTALVSLVGAEYGDILKTILWDGTAGTYFTTNPGGTHNSILYSLFFNYNPSGAFSEDIRITCKNK